MFILFWCFINLVTGIRCISVLRVVIVIIVSIWRGRVQQSLIGGMMWIGVKDGRYFVRHVCQDSDELKKYGWTSHNGRDYGHQVIIDQEMTLETSFLKYRGKNSGYGGDWVVRSDVRTEM